MKNLNINKVEEFNDLAELVELNNNACTSANDLFLQGFQVDLYITVTNKNGGKKDFQIVFQNTERTNGMMSYSAYGMSTAAEYGCDADESRDLEKWLGESEEYDFYQDVIDKCQDVAEVAAEAQYNFLAAAYKEAIL